MPIAEMTKSDEERLRSKRRAREPNMLERAFTKEDRPAMLRRATSETAIANSRSNFMKPSGGLRTNNTSGDGETFKLHFTVSESRTSSYLDASDRASDLSKDGHENSTSTLDRLDFRPEPRQAQSVSVPKKVGCQPSGSARRSSAYLATLSGSVGPHGLSVQRTASAIPFSVANHRSSFAHT